MKREQALEILKREVPSLRAQFGVERIGIFGSVARDEAVDESDVDLVVEMTPDIFRMVHMKERLEAALHARVDLVRYQSQMNAFLKQRIDSEAIYV
jgi:uncharacterized protein